MFIWLPRKVQKINQLHSGLGKVGSKHCKVAAVDSVFHCIPPRPIKSVSCDVCGDVVSCPAKLIPDVLETYSAGLKDIPSPHSLKVLLLFVVGYFRVRFHPLSYSFDTTTIIFYSIRVDLKYIQPNIYL